MTDDAQAARRAIESWHLGQTSARYESSNQGAGVISTGKGDHGGVSYGAYQLSTKQGTLREYLDQSSYGGQFKGLTPATPAFNAKWKDLAKTDPGFAQDQHDFIGRSHYGEQKSGLRAAGIDLSERGRAVQDALWSTSVQFRGLTPRIFAKGLEEKFGKGYELSSLSDKDIVEAVQDYKIAHNSTLFKSSPEWHPGLLKRAQAEKSDLVRLATQEETLKRDGITVEQAMPGSRPAKEQPSHHVSPTRIEHGQGVLREGNHNEDVRALQRSLGRLGYTDAHGHPIKADGDFGARTKAAVQAFQREQGLDVDGVAGSKTLEALKRADRQLLTHPQHEHHGLYTQVLEKVHAVEEQRGVKAGQHSEKLAAALTVEAIREGLTRIDRVELNDRGTLVRAVQVNPLRDEPGLNRTTDAISTQQASHQPLRESSEQVQQVSVNRQLQQEESQRQQVLGSIQAR